MEVTKKGIAAILSAFFPGLGQLIKGDFIKAILIWVIGGVISYLLFWTYIIPFGFWLWNVYDAYNSK